MNIKAFLFLSLFFVPLACKKNNNKHVAVCDGSSPTYDSFVQSLIASNCLSCHGAGSGNGDYSTYVKLTTITSNGKFENEVLTNQSMPQNGSLSESDLNKLRCWIDNGFPEN